MPPSAPPPRNAAREDQPAQAADPRNEPKPVRASALEQPAQPELPAQETTFAAARKYVRDSLLREPPLPTAAPHPPSPQKHLDQAVGVPARGAEPVFRAPDLLKAPAAASKNVAKPGLDLPDTTAEKPAGLMSHPQLREVIAWVQQEPPDTGPERAIAGPPEPAPPAAERVREKIELREQPVWTPAPPAPAFEDVSPRSEAQPAPVKPTVLEVRPASSRPSVLERLPAAATRSAEPVARGLTVNHLNVQVVNEDRHRKQEKHPPKLPSAAAVPRDDWGRFGRQYLRLP
jgi:hypothetical protein